MTQAKQVFFIISDAVGETARQVTRAALAQFAPDLKSDLRRYPFVKTQEELGEILRDAQAEKAIVAATFVNDDLDRFARQYAKDHQLTYINFLQELIQGIGQATGLSPKEQAGGLRKVDDAYLARMSAVEFAIKYDDGNYPKKAFSQADIIILGVSRSSKTPLSLYLANRGYRVANYPLIPEVRYPEELYQLDPNKVFGLMASPQYIMNIRTNRLKYLGLTSDAKYSQLERIKYELVTANDLYRELGAHVIDIEYKSIEESGAEIIEYLKEEQ
ncbi:MULTISPECIES: pyruvate, water dikinase regulatory protein [Aerococcus]|uniref:pyruvate, water dikinase regulatory protein n=1 Tax=Aerococcus TaxID=1375 RepID=UPI000DCB7C16|nr:pyruvate, water dikinase regulatory protein [Aerococcus urinae]RAV96001.1 phosphoenolpyruvate synthase regulatory protein [Aerococcus mictus]MDK6375502.1 pyruvate, water dikinase regulatory protein [Aerococcus urinae]MDK6421051.1 pyruvate, water dikinase regulatory protein [Aerococcus urinae]MDK8074396.1 pyruvate, water dikinase regulatory protein [Aerococcus urinae]MDK8083824.1 pyruvate, water dikinase regulatory protein [Aerococcus urinae]